VKIVIRKIQGAVVLSVFLQLRGQACVDALVCNRIRKTSQASVKISLLFLHFNLYTCQVYFGVSLVVAAVNRLRSCDFFIVVRNQRAPAK